MRKNSHVFVDIDGILWQSSVSFSFHPVSGLTDCIMVDKRRDFGVVLQGNGEVFGWGSNHHGQLSGGVYDSFDVPTQVYKLKDIESVSCGVNFLLALDTGGVVWGCGGNMHKALGSNDDWKIFTPQIVSEDLPSMKMIFAGFEDACGVDTKNRFWAWGKVKGKKTSPHRVKLPFVPRKFVDGPINRRGGKDFFERYALDTEYKLWKRCSTWKEGKYKLEPVPVENVADVSIHIFGTTDAWVTITAIGADGEVAQKKGAEWSIVDLPEPVYKVVDTNYFSSDCTVWTNVPESELVNAEVLEVFVSPLPDGPVWKKVQLPFKVPLDAIANRNVKS